MKPNIYGRGRRSIRLRSFDYSTPTAYYITVCTKDRECLLENDPIPAILGRAWRLTVNGGLPVPEWDFVVMPNHIHGIVWLPETPHTPLADAVRSFKSLCTRSINNLRGTPGASVWQRNYYERIVRNERELARFRQYILDNPSRWNADPNHPTNLQHFEPTRHRTESDSSKTPTVNGRSSDVCPGSG